MLDANDYYKADRASSYLTAQMLQGILRLHELQVVHNDIWKCNLVIDGSDHLRIIDWESAAVHVSNPNLDKHPHLRDDVTLLQQVGWNGFCRHWSQLHRTFDKYETQIVRYVYTIRTEHVCITPFEPSRQIFMHV
jgi:serine/threonine protein kinase